MKINIIQTTVNSNKNARIIAEYLVKKKISPCVQIVKINESIYQWNSKIKYMKEYLLIIKTIPEHTKQCKKYILELNNYEIPEIIITKGEILLEDYSDWFLENITK